MANIIVLPEHISNKIAAGEVVERPASVVKELMENSIDAGATKIELEIKDGGQTYIRVADDGCGMSAEDALLSLQRHATSKIKSDKDLFSIKTLGFRGEALPSIAAVSRMKLTTCLHDAPAGTFIRIEAGQIKENRQTGAAAGTVIEVADLFFNTPARRKFLKSKLTEASHITDIITRYCLSYPQIHFVFTHGRQKIYALPSVKTIAERITSIWSTSFFKELIPVKKRTSLINITGFVAKPSYSRASRSGQYIFINKRPIRSNSISHALGEAYQGLLTKGRFPIALLFLEIDSDQVDVNIHPTKREVKLSREKEIHDLITNMVRDTLKTQPLIPSVQFPEKHQASQTKTSYQPTKESDLFQEDITEEIEKPAVKKWLQTDQGKRITEAIGEYLDKHQLTADLQQKYLLDKKTSKRDPQTILVSKPDKTQLPEIIHIFGQLNNSYILCQIEDGLLIIDQHAAHERITYEKLQHDSRNTRSEQQPLLIPVTLELSHQEALYLEGNLPLWQELGFEIEEFGSDTFIIRSLPQCANKPTLVNWSGI